AKRPPWNAKERGQMMSSRSTTALGVVLAAVAAASVYAQQAPPAPPVPANPSQHCTLTPAQIAAGRNVVLTFFTTTGDARVALADPTYKQHNPAFKKRAEENKVSDYEAFKNAFGSAALAARR